MRYELSRHVELVEREGEYLLVSRNPLTLLRLNRSLAELVGSAGGGALTASTPAEAAVLEQLAAKGLVVRVGSDAVHPRALPKVSIVIPVKDRAEELGRCLASIAALDYPRELLETIVVDDGSSDRSGAVAREAGAVVIPSGGKGRGPAAARNVGARAATGEILAFIDSDCTAQREWLTQLLPAFSDRKTAAVGGLVEGMCTVSAVDRYESVMSSLSLGSRERIGNRGNDTFYLPSCNLLVRRHVFLGIGGFNDEMHVGEDVDLTWRLRDGGWTITYLPRGTVFHEHRSTLRTFMSRRFDYGTSEGILQLRHPLRRKRMVVPPVPAALLALFLAAPLWGWWLAAVAALLLAADVLRLRRSFGRNNLPVKISSLAAGRLRATGSLAYYLCQHLIRYYTLPLILLSLVLPSCWVLFFAPLVCSATVDHQVRKPPLSLPLFTAVYFLEQLAYGSGVFWGCVKQKTFASYRIVFFRQLATGGWTT